MNGRPSNEAAVGGDVATGQGVARLYDTHGAMCYRLAHRIIGDPDLAGEVVVDVFVTAWHSRRTAFGPSRSTANWLVATTHRRALEVRHALTSDP